MFTPSIKLQLGSVRWWPCRNGQEMYQKACCKCRLRAVFLLIEPIAFFDVLVAVDVVIAEAPYLHEDHLSLT